VENSQSVFKGTLFPSTERVPPGKMGGLCGVCGGGAKRPGGAGLDKIRTAAARRLCQSHTGKDSLSVDRLLCVGIP
jgi:hypothetical protein